MSDSQWKSVGLGIRWAAATQVLTFVGYLATEAARGRLLDAAFIGTFAAAMWLIGLAQVVGEAGFSSLLITERVLSHSDVRFVRASVGVVGTLGALGVLGAADVLGSWTRNSEVKDLAAALAPLLLLHALAAVPRGLLLRGLDFKKAGLADASATLTGCVATIALALAGAGPYALVGATLIGQAVRVLLLHLLAPAFAANSPDAASRRKFIGIAAAVTASRGLHYAYANADYFILSRLATAAVLGAYFNGFRLASVSSMLITAVFQQVSLPALSASNAEAETSQKRFREILRRASMVSFPLAFGLAAVADDAVDFVYGPGWSSVPGVVKPLCVLMAFRAISVLGPALLLARGGARTNVVISLLYVVVMCPLFFAGARFGAQGIAWIWMCGGVPLDVFVLAYCARTVGLSFRQVLSTMVPWLVRAALMSVIAAGAAMAMAKTFDETTSGIRLLVAVSLGGLIYVGLTLRAEPTLLAYLRQFIRRHGVGQI